MPPPNILHITVDQQRADTIRALGNRFIHTPVLDRLTREGTAFVRAYAPVAECVPSRAAMITGQYADRTGCSSNADLMPPEACPTLMSLLRDAGYRTHGIGKCHFTPDPWALRGFQERETSEEIAEDPARDDYLKFVKRRGFSHILEPHGIRGEMYYVPQPSQLPAGIHHSSWVADRCRAFLSRRRTSAPWYLYAGFIHPHPPFAPPNPWHKLYRVPEVPPPHLPDADGDLVCFINRFQNRYKYRDRGWDLNLVRCIRSYYYACISFLDYQIGRILAKLELTGEIDRTLIVFTSDHGELLGDFGCFGKRSFHEAAMRIPLILRAPGLFPAAKTCRVPVSLVDLLPTLLAATGNFSPPECDGSNLAMITPKCRGKPRPVHFQYARDGDAICGVVTPTWKYAWSAPDQREFLFPMKTLPEHRNAASVPEYSKVLKSLRMVATKRASAFLSTRNLVHPSGTQWTRFPVKSLSASPDAGLLRQDPPRACPVLPPGYPLDWPGN